MNLFQSNKALPANYVTFLSMKLYYSRSTKLNINWRDVQRENVVNNVDKWPYKNKHTEQHKPINCHFWKTTTMHIKLWSGAWKIPCYLSVIFPRDIVCCPQHQSDGLPVHVSGPCGAGHVFGWLLFRPARRAIHHRGNVRHTVRRWKLRVLFRGQYL